MCWPVQDAEALTELPAQPVYIALVDICCGEEFLELVKSALLAVLEAVPKPALFGLITFSTKVKILPFAGLYSPLHPGGSHNAFQKHR